MSWHITLYYGIIVISELPVWDWVNVDNDKFIQIKVNFSTFSFDVMAYEVILRNEMIYGTPAWN